MGMSPWPVRKTIGIQMFLVASSRWKSSPLNPGSRTSNTRQLGISEAFLRRKLSADSKVSACSPTVLNRNLSEERTDGSSSITKTNEAAVINDSRQLLAA